jgi:hypothetical protein
MDAQVRILELEAALEAERGRLGHLRRLQYRDSADAATENTPA